MVEWTIFSTLWYTNIAIENGIYIVGLRHPVKMVTYHSCVSLPEGSYFDVRTFGSGLRHAPLK